ncbi:MAG: cation transporter [Parcubacteria group bacterium]
MGILGLVAGIAGLWIGHIASAFAFSEGMHSLSDSAADFYGSRISKRALQNPKKDAEIRKKGSWVIAALLVLAGGPIVYEMWSRFNGAESPVAKLMILAGVIAIAFNALRWLLLWQAQRRSRTSTREDLIDHVKTDLFHGFYLFLAGGLLWAYSGKLTPGAQLAIDLVLSGIVLAYILWRAWKIVDRHKHHHHQH